MIMSSVVFIISAIYIAKNLKENKIQEKEFENIANIVEENINIQDETNYTENTQNEIKIEQKNNDYKKRKLNELYNINSDFIGWISIENTSLNYPVMQNGDYYLRKNFYKNYSSYGTPYLAKQCNVKTSDNLIIYGHHIKNSQMFGVLENYKKENYYKNHSIVNFETIDENKNYKIFAVFKTVIESEQGFKYYAYIDLKDKNMYDSFVNKCKEISLYETNQTPIYGNKIITLSTCEYSTQNSRLVIVAYQI